MDSAVWKELLHHCEEVLPLMRFVIADGSKINFWEDSWLPKGLTHRCSGMGKYVSGGTAIYKGGFSHC